LDCIKDFRSRQGFKDLFDKKIKKDIRKDINILTKKKLSVCYGKSPKGDKK